MSNISERLSGLSKAAQDLYREHPRACQAAVGATTTALVAGEAEEEEEEENLGAAAPVLLLCSRAHSCLRSAQAGVCRGPLAHAHAQTPPRPQPTPGARPRPATFPPRAPGPRTSCPPTRTTVREPRGQRGAGRGPSPACNAPLLPLLLLFLLLLLLLRQPCASEGRREEGLSPHSAQHTHTQPWSLAPAPPAPCAATTWPRVAPGWRCWTRRPSRATSESTPAPLHARPALSCGYPRPLNQPHRCAHDLSLRAGTAAMR